MAIELEQYDATLEIENEIKRVAAKSGGNFGMFFSLKDGDKAKVRLLLNLNMVPSVIRHDLFNPATNKPEVNALCSDTSILELPQGQCKHCQTVKTMTDKKQRAALTAKKHFVIPVYVYAVKNAAGETVTFEDQDGNKQPVQGVKYWQIKPTSDVMNNLLNLYRGNEFLPGVNLTTMDLVISREGTGLETKYHVKDLPATPFTIDVPAQDRVTIVQRIADANPFELIGDPFPPSAAASSKQSVPDF